MKKLDDTSNGNNVNLKFIRYQLYLKNIGIKCIKIVILLLLDIYTYCYN